MAAITTRQTAGVGATVAGVPLTNAQLDTNFINLNTEVFVDNYPVIDPTLLLDFINSSVLDPRVTFTRASTATFFNSAGVLTSAAINAPRFDYNPSTLAAQGLLIEESRTNSIRNNTMVGAVAGTPGTLPTTWSTVLLGLTQTVVGTGTSNGVTYIDIRVNGTTTSAGTIQIKPDGNASGAITATSSQAWAMSSWIAIVGGSATNTTAQRLLINEYSAGPTYLRTAVPATNILAGGATLTRVSGAITTGASTTILEPIIGLDAASGVAIDITLRIGLPQLEQGAFATSVIPTTTTALTRSADVASVNTLSPWYNASAGTLYAEASVTSTDASNKFAAALSDGTTANYIGVFRQSDAQPVGQVQATTQQAALGTGATWTTTTPRKLALAYAVNDFAFSANGSAAQTDSSGTVPTVNQLQLGLIGSTQRLNGYLSRVTYYPTRLSNAQLQAITA
jgi:hypothetical protein